MRGGVGSGRVKTGYEVGGWGERHGALNDVSALREKDLRNYFGR